ncbi:MAG: ABC transporter permease [Phycisphaerales bacterium]|nr:ABC transporter permease [Phycisphaerales bacterium]
MALTDWTIIRRSLTSRLFSTLTTSITVAVAVGLLLVLLVMRESGQKAFSRGSGDMHMLVSADASPLVSILNGVFYANPPRRPITWSKYEQLAKSAPWDYFIPTQQGDSYRGSTPVMATTPEFFTKFRPNPGEAWELTEGRFFDKSFEVVLGSAAARSTGLKVGDHIHLTHGIGQAGDGDGSGNAGAAHEHGEFEYHIVGILRPTGGSHDRAMFTNLESTWLIHAHDRREREAHAEHEEHAEGEEHEHAHDDHEHGDQPLITAADLTEEDRKITGMYGRLVTRAGSDTPANLPQVFDQLRRDTTITVAAPRQEIDKLFTIVGNIDRIFVGMAIVVMISSGIGIMLALYNSMEQRRRQIAILRVMGCSQGRVFGLIVTESAVLGIAGAILGVLVSLVGARVVAGIMKERLGLAIDATMPLQAALMVVVAAIALAAAAGLIPAVMAYRTAVAKNLKPLG